jgi:hypothetical protein
MNEFQERVYHMFKNQKLNTKDIADRHYGGNEAGVERALHAAQEERHRLRAERELSLSNSAAPK